MMAAERLRRRCYGVEIDPRYFRPTEVDFLLGDPAKASRVLGWSTQISFKQLVKEMVEGDLENARTGRQNL